MSNGDSSPIRQMNRALILSKIIEYGSISRSDLAKVTGLNKSTLSVQAADLLAENVVIETNVQHQNPGRRPIALSINENAGCALGIDLDGTKFTFVLSTLLGNPLYFHTVEFPASNYNEMITFLTEEITRFQNDCDRSTYGLVGVALGIHGIVDNDEIIRYLPHHKWHDKNVKKDLLDATGLPIYVQNNANLSAYAEVVFMHHRTEHLISLSMHSGIGLGMMIQGQAMKGYHGFAGEIGHMIIQPSGKACSCGNFGCWEQYASETSFLRILSYLKNRETVSFQDIEQWIQKNDPITHQSLDHYMNYIAAGLNNVVNLFNPEVLILNSQLLQVIPGSLMLLKTQLGSLISQPCELYISKLGERACVMGACALVIKNFLGVQELSLKYNPN